MLSFYSYLCSSVCLSVVCSSDTSTHRRSLKPPSRTASDLNIAQLNDISELTPSPFSPSPSHSALSSSAASAESSPLSSSPPKWEVSSGNSGEKTPPNDGEQDDDSLQRSQSESTEGHLRLGAGSLLSRMKSMAAQHSQGDAIQRPVKIMKEIISSLAPTPLAGPVQSGGAGLVYTNHDSNGKRLMEQDGVELSSPLSLSEGSSCLPLSPEQLNSPSPPFSPPSPPVDPSTREFIASVNTARLVNVRIIVILILVY